MLLLLGTLFTINGIVLPFIININTGVILTLFLGAILLLYGIYFNAINKSIPKWLKASFAVCACFALCFAVFLYLSGTADSVTFQEDAIIVLGAGLDGDKPGITLTQRLDTAVEYYRKNPDVLIIVSGGQGPQEEITEAQAMKTYLISKGVPNDSILKEEKSTSTYENFQNSKGILDDHFQGDYRIAFVTNEYHIYRAGCVAKNAGITSPSHIHSTTEWYLILPSILRECLAVAKFWVLSR